MSSAPLAAIDLNRLRAISRRATVFSALGAAVTIGALLLAGYQLTRIEAQQKQASAALAETRFELDTTREQLTTARSSLAQAQCALRQSRLAIEAFHQQDYEVANHFYDEALRCDPKNAYLLNLKAYSLFRAGKAEGAIDTQEQSLKVDPKYAWGYFDLSRFFCAANAYDKAADARSSALKLRPDLADVMKQDGEFMRLCAPILK